MFHHYLQLLSAVIKLLFHIVVGSGVSFLVFISLLMSIFISLICLSLCLLLVRLLLLSFMPVGIIINPNMAMIPTTARPIPALLAIHMPLDHIFSPNITPANNAIHNKFIQPKDTIRRKYGQQHPRQYRP